MRLATTCSNATVSRMPRTGLAFVFAYASISSLQHPLEWVRLLPSFTAKMIDGTTHLKSFAIYEMALTSWLIYGKFLRYCLADAEQ